MSQVTLNGALVASLIDHTFPGGLQEFQRAWEGDEGAPERTTIYRWTKGQLPQSQEKLLRLAGLLDCDPIGLLAVNPDSPAKTINKLLASFQLDQLKPALKFMRGFFGRQLLWPPEEISSTYFGRPWYMSEFIHDPSQSANFYAPIDISGELQSSLVRPQLFHFAFRYPDLFEKRWLDYGFVTRSYSTGSIVHINGYTDNIEGLKIENPTPVETFFGPSKIVFRVASLHPFEVRVRQPGEAPVPRLRFPL